MEKLSPVNCAVSLGTTSQFFNTLHKNSGVLSSRSKEETNKKTDYFKNLAIYPRKKWYITRNISIPFQGLPTQRSWRRNKRRLKTKTANKWWKPPEVKGCSKLVSWVPWGRRQRTWLWENKNLTCSCHSNCFGQKSSAETMTSRAGVLGIRSGKPQKTQKPPFEKVRKTRGGYSLFIFLKDRGLVIYNRRNAPFQFCFPKKQRVNEVLT